jgi:catechol 2,3-dioxygenase-like lactoylglutathione lyase family enzyme
VGDTSLEEVDVGSTRDIILQTDRLNDARAFYRDTLGCELVSDDGRLLEFETGSFRLYVEPGSLVGPVFEFEVEDVDAERERLEQRGCEVIDEDPEVPRLYLRDPFGLVFNITNKV